jgi:hypothetical protein
MTAILIPTIVSGMERIRGDRASFPYLGLLTFGMELKMAKILYLSC